MKKILLGFFLLSVSWYTSANFINVRQTTELVSTDNVGTIGNNYSSTAFQTNHFITSDRRYITFTSEATNFVSWDVNGAFDVFLKDRQTWNLELISMTSTGGRGNGDSSYQMLSDDWRYVVFQSDANSFVWWDNNATSDIFLKDRQTGIMELISVNNSGQVWNWASKYPSITPDGRYVLFESASTNLVSWANDGRVQLYIRDRQTWILELISRNAAGVISNHSGNSIRGFTMTPDARYIVFHAGATNLVSGTTATFQIYLKDRQTSNVSLVSLTSSWVRWTNGSQEPVISADGRYVVFLSRAINFASWADSVLYQVYVRDLQLNTLELISSSLTWALGNDTSNRWAYISSGGRYVLFASDASNLVTWDTNWTWDIFLKDRLLNTMQRVSMSYTWWQLDGLSHITEISDDGKYVTYATYASNVMPIDTNTSSDVYISEYKTIYLDTPTILTPISWATLPINNIAVSGTGYSGYIMNLSLDWINVWTGTIDSGWNWEGVISGVAWWQYGLRGTQIYSTGWYVSDETTAIPLTIYTPIPTIVSPISWYTSTTWNVTIAWTWIAWALVTLTYSWGMAISTVNNSGSWNIFLHDLSNWYYTISVRQKVLNTSSAAITLGLHVAYTPVVITPPTWWFGGWWGWIWLPPFPSGPGNSGWWIWVSTPWTGWSIWTWSTSNSGNSTPIQPVIIPVDMAIFNKDFDVNTCYTKQDGTVIDQGNNMSSSFKKALALMKAYWLTKYNWTKDYRPFDSITRQDASRFLSQFGENILCRKPTRQYDNTFVDIGDADQTLTSYIIKAYELGIFKWDDAWNFRPRKLISQDEFTAGLIRLIFNKYLPEDNPDWAKPYRDISASLFTKTSGTQRGDLAIYMALWYNMDYEYDASLWYVLKNASEILAPYSTK